MPGEWDAFPLAEPPAAAPPASSAPTRITVRPSDAGWDRFPVAEQPGMADYALDVAQSIPAGLTKGVTGIAGSLGDLRELGNAGGEALLDFVADKLSLPKEWVEASKRLAKEAKPFLPTPLNRTPTTAQVRDVVKEYGPDFLQYEPQTRPGHYAETAAEFVPGAGRKLLTMAALPGAASEFVGEATKGSAIEPWARAGAAIVTSGAGAALTRPRTAEKALRREIPEGVDRAVIDKAETLITDARSKGVALTWPEAIEQVAPGKGQGLLQTQRLLESARDTRQELAPYFAERPGQMDRAARGEFESIAPASPAPSNIGPAVGGAATETVRDVERLRTKTVQPYYEAADQTVMAGKEMRGFINEIDKAIKADKTGIIAKPLQEIRDLLTKQKYQPAKPPKFEAGPDVYEPVIITPGTKRKNEILHRDLESLDRVRKYVRDKTEMPQIGQDAITKEQGAAILKSLDALEQRMIAASPEFQQGKDLYQYITRQYLDPLMAGPIGKLADKDLTTKRAIEVLFPSEPLAGSAQEIGQAVSAVAKRSPSVAASLVRAHVEATFNLAARDLKSGPSQAVGGKFVSALVGNPQQRANLQAAVEALPNGAKTWEGFERFLEIAAATGKRQDIGSRTAFNASDLKDLSGGKAMTEGAKAVASTQRLLTGLGDAWDRWQLGRNLNELARILTDPQSGRLLTAIAQRPQGAREAQILAARLANMANQVRVDEAEKSQQAGDKGRR